MALILIIGIVIIFDISEKIDDFVSKEAPLKAIIFDYYVNFVPYFMNMFSPLFVFITVIFFTSKMASDSEIVAILSCGISFHRMMVPYIFSATLIAIMSLYLNLFVIPESNKTRVEFEETYIKSKTKAVGRNVHYQIAPGEFVYAESFSSWNNTAYKFTLERIENNKLVSKLSAETAVYNEKEGTWTLKKYFIRDYNEDLTDKIRSGRQIDTTLALTVKDFYLNENTSLSAYKEDFTQTSIINDEGFTVGKSYLFAASDTERTIYIKAPIATASEPVVWSLTHDVAGIDNLMGAQLAVTLYPNPTDGLFYVNVPTAAEGATVSVTTISGTTLYSSLLDEGLIAIDLRGQLSAGVYLVIVKSDKQVSASKLIVK